MQRRRVGPVPLLQGVQLDPPVGKPGGLLDVRNMEGRNGHLSTRRGVVTRGDIASEGTEIDAVTITSITALNSPFTSNAEYLELVGFTPEPGERLILEVDPTTANDNEFDYVDIAYSSEDAGSHTIAEFRSLPYVWLGMQLGIEIIFGGSTSKSTWISFICPDDWVTVSGKHYLRLTPRTRDSSDQNWGNSFDPATLDLYKITLEARKSMWVPFREGARVVTMYDALTDKSRQLADWSKMTLASGDAVAYPESRAISGTESTWAGESDVSMLYVPSTNELLVMYDAQPPLIEPKVMVVNGDGFVVQAQNVYPEDRLFPDTNVEDTAWQDVPVEGSLGPIACAALFNQRVVVGGGFTQPQRVRWGAPAEFARIFPSDNFYDLVGGGGGRIVGMAVIHRTLFIFTSTAIWSVHEVDPIEGEDSRMIFNVVEETGCLARDSIVVVDGQVWFLSRGGIRRFDGQRSSLVTRDVEDLFREDSEHPMAVRPAAHQRLRAVYDPVEGLYYLFYRRPDEKGNDCALVISTVDGTCWLWGEDRAGTTEATDSDDTEDGRRPWGFRAAAPCWDESEQKVFVVEIGGLGGHIAGTEDHGMRIPWRFETHHVGLGTRDFQVVAEVDIEMARVHDAVKVDVSVIKEGRLDLKDTRTLTIERGGATADTDDARADYIQTSSANVSETDKSYVPLKWRGRNRGMNHRVLVESYRGNTVSVGGTNTDDWREDDMPVSIAALSVDVIDSGRR